MPAVGPFAAIADEAGASDAAVALLLLVTAALVPVASSRVPRVSAMQWLVHVEARGGGGWSAVGGDVPAGTVTGMVNAASLGLVGSAGLGGATTNGVVVGTGMGSGGSDLPAVIHHHHPGGLGMGLTWWGAAMWGSALTLTGELRLRLCPSRYFGGQTTFFSQSMHACIHSFMSCMHPLSVAAASVFSSASPLFSAPPSLSRLRAGLAGISGSALEYQHSAGAPPFGLGLGLNAASIFSNASTGIGMGAGADTDHSLASSSASSSIAMLQVVPTSDEARSVALKRWGRLASSRRAVYGGGAY